MFAAGDLVWAHNMDPGEWQVVVRLPGTVVGSYRFIDETHYLVELPSIGSTLSHRESWLEPREEE